MSNPSIDLGRPQFDPDQSCRPAALSDRFNFGCAGCGDCCRGRKDLILSGYDLWRICRRLSLPPAVVVQGYCRQSVGVESLLPVLRIRPLAQQGHNCPFLYQSRCSIHEAAPLACALYPLMQQIDTQTGAITYYAQPTDCGVAATENTVGQFLHAGGVLQRQNIDREWARGCTRLSGRVCALAPTLHPAQLKMVQQKAFQHLYLSLDWQRPYLPQLQAALAQLDHYLDKVAARAGQGSVPTQKESL